MKKITGQWLAVVAALLIFLLSACIDGTIQDINPWFLRKVMRRLYPPLF